MHPKLRKFLILFAKHAVNALLTNTVLMTMLHSFANLHTKIGWEHVSELALSTVVSREAMVWIPKLLAWSASTNGDQSKGAQP